MSNLYEEINDGRLRVLPDKGSETVARCAVGLADAFTEELKVNKIKNEHGGRMEARVGEISDGRRAMGVKERLSKRP